MTRGLILFVVAISSACHSMNVQLPDEPRAAQLAGTTPIYVEPISEVAELETRHQTIPMGQVTVTKTWQEKPFLAKQENRRALHKMVLRSLAADGLLGTSDIPPSPPDNILVARTTVLDHRVIDSNALWQRLSCVGAVFGLLFPPLYAFGLYNAIVPITYDEVVTFSVQVFDIPAAEVNQRRRQGPAGVEPVFDVQGLVPVAQKEFEHVTERSVGYVSEMFYGVTTSVAEHQTFYLQAVLPLFADGMRTTGQRAIANRGPAPAAPAPPPAPPPDKLDTLPGDGPR